MVVGLALVGFPSWARSAAASLQGAWVWPCSSLWPLLFLAVAPPAKPGLDPLTTQFYAKPAAGNAKSDGAVGHDTARDSCDLNAFAGSQQSNEIDAGLAWRNAERRRDDPFGDRYRNGSANGYEAMGGDGGYCCRGDRQFVHGTGPEPRPRSGPSNARDPAAARTQ